MPGPVRGYPSFRTPPALARAVRATGWDACSTASNHSLDAGQRGIDTTLRALDRAGLGHAGTARSARERRRTGTLRVRGVTLAFLSYTAVSNGQRVPHPWSLDTATPRLILADARRARRDGADAAIVNLIALIDFVAGGDRVTARRVRYVPTVVRRPGYRVTPAARGSASWARTVAAAGRGPRVRPVS